MSILHHRAHNFLLLLCKRRYLFLLFELIVVVTCHSFFTLLTPMPNRLSQETSPYLLQHQNNPVDWYAWSEEALTRAKAEQRPIFLSIGYSACHWCHVMEHESFENGEIAKLLNERFICIKVDREERPDLDQIYMTAVQLLTGRGGWPMSVFSRRNCNLSLAVRIGPRMIVVACQALIASLWRSTMHG